jgi:hypothetical protein
MTQFDRTVPCEERDAKAEHADSDELERLETNAGPPSPAEDEERAMAK